MSNDNQKSFKDTIVIDGSISNNSNSAITIGISDSNNQSSNDNSIYKISEDGKVIFNAILSNLDSLTENQLKNEKPREILINELINYGFEKIPVELNEVQLRNILEFSIIKVIKNVQYGQIYPFSVEKANNGDLIITLLIYNSSALSFAMDALPITLTDANNKIVFSDLVNLNKSISPKKTGIYYIKINKDALKEDNINLLTWSITFEVE